MPTEKCKVCGCLQLLDVFAGAYTCSDFCESTTKAQQRAFLALEEGRYGIWPCAECHRVVQGEYHMGAFCGECGPRVRARVNVELLCEALPHLPSELADRVRKALSVT